MPITIKEIAQLAGVSRGTVDRALNGRGGVSKEVEERILEIAKENGYRPNLAAKSLAMKSQKLTIGVVIYSKGNEFFDVVLDGIYEAASEIKEFAISVMVEELEGYNVQEQLDSIDKFIDMGVNAIAITPLNDPQILEKLDSIKHIPIVALNVDIEGKHHVDYIGCDYYKSGQTAGAMMGLFCGGAGNVLIVIGNKKVYGHVQRVKGFTQVTSSKYDDINIVDVVECFDINELSYKVVNEAIAKYPHIDSLYFVAGGADGGVDAIAEIGKGEEYVIITNDTTNSRIQYLKSGIINATICQQPYEQGYNCIKELFNCIMNNRITTGRKNHTNIGIKLKYNFN